jgi:glycosyltransferase involved in cell wall biosynthesis
MGVVFIIMPAYNEAKSISKVISKLKHENYQNIIVVDDGSKDNTYRIACERGIIAIKHIVNRGLGGALGTGIMAALQQGADIIVTFDSDGQHSVKDIKDVIDPIIRGEADVVIGVRQINSYKMPFYKKIGNLGLNGITYLLFGIYCSDTQSGFRAFSSHAAKKINLKTNGYAVSSEIIKEIGKNRLKMKEVPIHTIYTKYSVKRGTNFFSGIRILMRLTLERLLR